MAPPGIGKPRTLGSGVVVVGLNAYSCMSSFSMFSIPIILSGSISRVYPVPFKACAIERTSGWTVPLAIGRTERSMPFTPPAIPAM